MKSLGFGDHSRREFRGEGGFELALERYVLGKEGKGKGAHSRPRRSISKFVITIWGRGRWWIRGGGQTSRQVLRTGVGKWCEIQAISVGDTQIMRCCKIQEKKVLALFLMAAGCHWGISGRWVAASGISLLSLLAAKITQAPGFMSLQHRHIFHFEVCPYFQKVSSHGHN